MSTRGAFKRLKEEFGELVERHDVARDLTDFKHYADDPVGFIRNVLKETDPGPWDAQEDIANAVREHPLVRVQSCNGAGKDWLAARLALWWVYARHGLVLVTGPTERQVREIVMGEVARSFGQAENLPGELFQMALRLGRAERAGILAFTSSDASRLTGFHAPRVLVIITEAQGVEDFAWEGLLACATGSEDRMLVVGNPLSPSGRFYTTSKSKTWHSFTLSAAVHPNVVQGREIIPGSVTRRFMETTEAEFGRDSSVYQSRVLGLFPEDAEEALIPRAWIEAAIERAASGECEDWAQGEPLALGLDPARYGPDETVLAVRQGPVLRELIGWRGKSTMESEARVRRELARLRAHYRVEAHVVVDVIGLGAGIVDRLAERQDVIVFEFNSATSSSNPARFANLRAEAFWELRTLLEDGLIALPPDEKLAKELAQIRWSVVPSSGAIRIEPKDDLRSRLGRSPDRADACAMAFAPTAPVEEVELFSLSAEAGGWIPLEPGQSPFG